LINIWLKTIRFFDYLFVLGEDLHGVEAEFFSGEQSVVHAAGDGEVGAEHS
jgi:hypothetical protein